MSTSERQARHTTTLELHETHEQEDDDGNESDYSLDYEYPGPRYANCRVTLDDNDQASDLSDIEAEEDLPRFDMWDDDPYNDFTWELNDMQLTKFMKRKQRELKAQQHHASFWKKEKGWPKQLPYSCSSTNHDQSANAICLVESNYGSSEQLYAVYRDRIILCGKPPIGKNDVNKPSSTVNPTTLLNRSNVNLSTKSDHNNNKFLDTHQSVSLSKLHYTTPPTLLQEQHSSAICINKFEAYTKYIKRSDYPRLLLEDAYLPLGFDPQCLAQKYGYMAIGGVEGEFELYCCMDQENPVKIWGTKFKGNDNVMLMTNAIQIVRWKNRITGEYEHMLIGCMNEAGLLFYHLPKHEDCKEFRLQQQNNAIVKLHSHLRTFNNVPINDAKLSPDGTKLVCVGDDNVVFMIDVYHCTTTGDIQFSAPNDVVIPTDVFQQKNIPYSSQYVAWSPSSEYFAHTSDSHNSVLIWRAATMELLYQVDAAGYTYAILFHPQLDNILVFTNRYGYFHTINLSNAKVNGICQDILTFDHQTESSRGHQCVDTCIQGERHPVFHTRHFQAQHEITMVSFRGEINTRLRILAKINGMEWSKDGRYLYLATKKRVLAFRFLMTHDVPSLLDITSLHIRTLIEREEGSRKRKKFNIEALRNWPFLPNTIQSRILGNNTQQLACHW
ncbi:unnamed protein product [Mucor hiemalis]